MKFYTQFKFIAWPRCNLCCQKLNILRDANRMPSIDRSFHSSICNLLMNAVGPVNGQLMCHITAYAWKCWLPISCVNICKNNRFIIAQCLWFYTIGKQIYWKISSTDDIEERMKEQERERERKNRKEKRKMENRPNQCTSSVPISDSLHYRRAGTDILHSTREPDYFRLWIGFTSIRRC